jgi:hypothetical protein
VRIGGATLLALLIVALGTYVAGEQTAHPGDERGDVGQRQVEGVPTDGDHRPHRGELEARPFENGGSS